MEYLLQDGVLSDYLDIMGLYCGWFRRVAVKYERLLQTMSLRPKGVHK